MKLIKCLPFLIISVLFISACDDNGNNSTQYDFNPGSFWNYEITVFYDDSTTTSSEQLYVTSVTFDEDTPVYNLRSDDVHNFRWTDVGFYEHWSVPGTEGGWYNRLFHYPTYINESWEMIADWGPFNIQCKNIHVDLAIEAGEFHDCVIYQIDRDLHAGRFGWVWFHPQYGILQETHGTDFDSPYYVKELVEYQIR